jgi:glycosyltransferase involved in cell wall biosynthesis
VPCDALVFSSVASLFPYKGHRCLLQALTLIRDQLPADWLLLAAGRDPDNNLAELVSLAEQLGLGEHVRFLGERLDVPAILSAADIHVSASQEEGFPNNILEAMSAGLPVVATAVGGVPEQVTDETTGLLVPPDNPGALALALLLLAGDRTRRLSMGRAGRQRVEQNFSLERSIDAFAQAYARAAARAGNA